MENDLTHTILDGKYELVRLLGTGGMGTVYEARHVILGKRVAVKFLHSGYASDEAVVQRFFREAQAAAAIGHKNIIDVMDVAVTSEGVPYLVMEYLEGESLGSLIARRNRVDVAAACGIMEPVLLALGAAHQTGIVHRDLKPDNIFLAHREGAPPQVKLIDFGISKHTRGTGETNLTQAGSVLGTPCYMSPEQAAGGEVDARSDLWSAGVILHELLTGEPPFDGDNVNMILAAVLTKEVPRPTTRFADFPIEAEQIVMRALARDRDHRFSSAAEMLEWLRSINSFQERHDGLTLAAVGMERDVASGDLGTPSPRIRTSVAAEVLGQMAVRGTLKSGEDFQRADSAPPNRGTQQAWSDSQGAAAVPQKRQRWLWAVAATIVVAVAVVVVVRFIVFSPKVSTAVPLVASSVVASPPSQEVSSAKSTTARIDLRGVPDGSTVMVDDALQTANLFTLPISDKPIMISVEHPDYHPYRTEITPSENMALEVPMRPKSGMATGKTAAASPRTDRPAARKATSTKAHSAESETKTTPPPAEPTAVPQPTETPDDVKKGRRGTKYVTDFE